MRNWNVEDKVLPGIHIRVKHKDPYMNSHLYPLTVPEEDINNPDNYLLLVDYNQVLLKTVNGLYLAVKK